MKILREHWEQTKRDNQQQIIGNKITILMAQEVIKLCDRMLASFPAPKINPVNAKNQKNLRNRKI